MHEIKSYPNGSPWAENVDKDIQRLFLSYHLCLQSLKTRGVLSNFLQTELFYSSVVAYYSVVQTKNGQPKKWIMKELSDPTGDVPIDWYSKKRTLSIEEVLADMRSIYNRFRELRNRYIAHNSGFSSTEYISEWIDIPPMIDSVTPPRISAYVKLPVRIPVSSKDRELFLHLIGFTARIYWRRAGLPPVNSVEFDELPSNQGMSAGKQQEGEAS